jgi:putative membrane protein
MQDLITTHYLTIKALHVIAMTAWMAAMFYLPRLFVYHAGAPKGGELSETLKIMEMRLLRYIANPAMIVTLILGYWLLKADVSVMQAGWMHVKLTAVLGMIIVHGLLARHRKQFLQDRNQKPARYYRILNEVPTVLLIVIVFMAILKPF